MAAVVAVVFLMLPFGVASTVAQEAQVSQEEVRTRDDLIFAQESLLNVYRCRFDVDTQIVPGGCTEGEPAEEQPPPVPFEGAATSHDLDARDQLIESQESLLNDYRCLFKIDVQIVPGGCSRIAIAHSGAIWTMRGDSKDQQRIASIENTLGTDFFLVAESLAWSPSSQRIAYAKNYYEKPSDGYSNKSEIWITNIDGTNHELLVETGFGEYQQIDAISWSPDGRKIAYQNYCCEIHGENAAIELWLMNADGTNRNHLANIVGERGYSWSPNGSQIAYYKVTRNPLFPQVMDQATEIWVANADGSNARKLSDIDSVYGPIWSPDGTRLAVELISRGTNHKEIWVLDVDGTNERKITGSQSVYDLSKGHRAFGFAWAPDSMSIAFIDFQEESDVLVVVDVDGSNRRQLVELGATRSAPVWSPDGTRIAYSAGRFDPVLNSYTSGGLWIVRIDDSTRLQLAVGPVSAQDASWSP
ncbi:hypothetical protein [Candidatus Poriferisocius sp.]|uniref:hypothetical protein n=1 Tax=Candidatus Poriferisocius sp. TaxID=3101276 RepID=UPI003B029208